MTDTTGADQIETEAEALALGNTSPEIWLKKIKRARDDEKDWHEDAEAAVKVYEADDQTTSFNIFHSNIETLLPSLYNSTPIPDVRRRYGDADPIGKVVVDMTERCLSYLVDQYDFDDEMVAAVKDSLVPGRGVIRVRYEATNTESDGVEQKTYEEITCEHVAWDRFTIGPAKRWADVPWVAFKHDLTRDELVKLAGVEGSKLTVKATSSKDDDDEKGDKGIFRTACVYEIWDKDSKSVLFIAEEDKTKPLKVEPDPLRLDKFFPVPRPIQQIKRVSSLTPVTPYKVYSRLIAELDSVTKRIAKLVAQLKVRGLVSAEIAKDMEGLRSLEDGQYIAANDSATFLAGGGKLENAIAHMPMEPTVAALQQLYIQREQIKQSIYEITGLSDIVRGASDAGETATAQQIKTQWGSLRIQNLQREVQRLARDLYRLKAELMATHFEPGMLVTMSNMAPQQGADPQAAQGEMQKLQAALQMFKSEMRTFRVDIETDSTIRADLTRNQEQMSNFLLGTGQFADGMAKIVPLMPQLLPTVVEVYTAFARNFSLGKQAEDALDALGVKSQEMAAQAEQQGQEDPEAKKIEMQMAFEAKKLEGEMQLKQMDMKLKELDLQIKQALAQIDMQKAQMELQLKREGMALDMEAKQADIQLKRETAAMDLQTKREGMEMQRVGQQVEMDHKMQVMDADRQHKTQMADIKQKQAAQPRNGAAE